MDAGNNWTEQIVILLLATVETKARNDTAVTHIQNFSVSQFHLSNHNMLVYLHICLRTIGGDESGVAISQIPDFLGLYSLIPDFLGLYSLIPDFWGLYSLIPDFRPLRPVPTFSRPIIMFYIFHMIEKIYINAYPPPPPILALW